VQGLAEGIAKVAPDAWVAIISNPVNSTVPIVAEVFKRAGGQRTPCSACLQHRCSQFLAVSMHQPVASDYRLCWPCLSEWSQAGW
jgi:malate/lactate dehydrogenase